jgi:hypothetical protein
MHDSKCPDQPAQLLDADVIIACRSLDPLVATPFGLFCEIITGNSSNARNGFFLYFWASFHASSAIQRPPSPALHLNFPLKPILATTSVFISKYPYETITSYQILAAVEAFVVTDVP